MRMTRLGDLIAIKHGFAFLGEHFGDFGSHVVLTPGNFLEEGGFISKAGKEKWYRGPVPSEYVLRTGDLLVAMTEQAEGLLGSSLLVPEDDRYLHNQRLGLVQVRDPHRTDTRFLYYLFNHRPIRQQIRGSASGTKIRHTSPSRIADVKALVPQVAVQRRIASILAAYDTLIENCQRRIRILEDMARGLYREWFVHFRFPGADALPRVDSQLGPIPQGWHVSTIGALTSKIGSGSTPRGGKDVYERAGISLIRSLNVYDYRFEPANLAFINDEQASTLRNVELRERDVLLNITGASVARCCLTPSYALPARVNQHVAIVRTDPQLANPFFVLDSINNEQNKQRLLGLAQGGATREALTKETIANFALIVPSVKLMQRYEFIASPIHQQRETLARRVANLRRTRDLLLPRLLSGQIGVGVAESMAGAEAPEPAAAA